MMFEAVFRGVCIGVELRITVLGYNVSFTAPIEPFCRIQGAKQSHCLSSHSAYNKLVLKHLVHGHICDVTLKKK